MENVKQFEGVFELFQEQPRRQVNGDKLQLIFEKPFTETEQKVLVDFFDKSVQVSMQEYAPEGSEKGLALLNTTWAIDSVFEVVSTNPRRLANGNKTRFVLEKMYDKETHRQAVELFQKDVQVFMNIIQQELSLAEPEVEVGE